MEIAVKKGHTTCVKWFIDKRLCDSTKRSIKAIDQAAQHGHLEILKFFHELDSSAYYENSDAKGKLTDSWLYAKDPITWAAKGGHLAVLEWFHSNRSQQGSVDAMDFAAAQGHLEVVKWLHLNRSEGCTKWAMDDAAANGHLNVVQWLHVNRSEGCTDTSMYLAAKNGHLEVVKWLYANVPESHTYKAIDRAIGSAHLPVAVWLLSRFPDYRIGSRLGNFESLTSAYNFWYDLSSFDVLLWLHVRAPYVFTSQFLKTVRADTVRRSQHVLISSWLDEHYATTIPEN